MKDSILRFEIKPTRNVSKVPFGKADKWEDLLRKILNNYQMINSEPVFDKFS